jgi:hypothetical protein
MTSPNQYHLSGHGVTVSYFPDGSGPPTADGPIVLVYQDVHGIQQFRQSTVRKVENTDLGTIVSVTIATTVDTGSTSFSLLVPDVELPAIPNPSAHVKTTGIITIHHILAGAIGHPQHDVYSVIALTGTGSESPLPE